MDLQKFFSASRRQWEKVSCMIYFFLPKHLATALLQCKYYYLGETHNFFFFQKISSLCATKEISFFWASKSPWRERKPRVFKLDIHWVLLTGINVSPFLLPLCTWSQHTSWSQTTHYFISTFVLPLLSTRLRCQRTPWSEPPLMEPVVLDGDTGVSTPFLPKTNPSLSLALGLSCDLAFFRSNPYPPHL